MARLLQSEAHVVNQKHIQWWCFQEKYGWKNIVTLCVHDSQRTLEESHFLNYCLSNFGKFSRAVDCFLELCFLVFRNYLHNVSAFWNFVPVKYAKRKHWCCGNSPRTCLVLAARTLCFICSNDCCCCIQQYIYHECTQI